MTDQDNHAQPSTCTTKHYYQDNMTRLRFSGHQFLGLILCVILRLTASKMVFRFYCTIYTTKLHVKMTFISTKITKKIDLFFSHVILVFTCHFFTKFTVTWISPGTQHC